MEYNILLNVDINDFQALCQSHSIFNKISHDNHFWIDRFQYDHIPLTNKQNSKINWFNEYTKTIKSLQIVNLVVNDQENLLTPFKDILLTDILNIMIEYDFEFKAFNYSIESEYKFYKNVKLGYIIINMINPNLYKFLYICDAGVPGYYFATCEQVKKFIFNLTYHYCIKKEFRNLN